MIYNHNLFGFVSDTRSWFKTTSVKHSIVLQCIFVRETSSKPVSNYLILCAFTTIDVFALNEFNPHTRKNKQTQKWVRARLKAVANQLMLKGRILNRRIYWLWTFFNLNSTYFRSIFEMEDAMIKLSIS